MPYEVYFHLNTSFSCQMPVSLDSLKKNLSVFIERLEKGGKLSALPPAQAAPASSSSAAPNNNNSTGLSSTSGSAKLKGGK